MNKNEIISIIMQRVMIINEIENVNLVLEIDKDGLRVYDVNNGCKGLLDGYFPSRLYFGKDWDDYFLETANKLNNILDKYEEF